MFNKYVEASFVFLEKVLFSSRRLLIAYRRSIAVKVVVKRNSFNIGQLLNQINFRKQVSRF